MSVALWLATALSVSAPSSCPAPAAPVAVRNEPVAAEGLVAEIVRPERAQGRLPAIVLLDGSQPGLDGARDLAKPFAEQGYVVMALAYYGAPGLPADLQEVPLEYFDRAIAWLATRPDVDPERIGLYGQSKGAEGGLLVATRNPAVKASALAAPSHVAWQGLNFRERQPRSSWSVGGQGVAFARFDTSRGFDPRDWVGSVYRFYEGAVATAPAEAEIPVERAKGRVFLFSGSDDKLWPAAAMGERAAARARANGAGDRITHRVYPDAGHVVGAPPGLVASANGPDEAVGGTVEGNRAARAAAYRDTLCFFSGALTR